MRHAVRGFLKTRKGSNSHRPVRGPGKTRTSFEIAGILTQRTPLSGGKDDDFHFSKSFSLQPGIGYIVEHQDGQSNAVDIFPDGQVFIGGMVVAVRITPTHLNGRKPENIGPQKIRRGGRAAGIDDILPINILHRSLHHRQPGSADICLGGLHHTGAGDLYLMVMSFAAMGASTLFMVQIYTMVQTQTPPQLVGKIMAALISIAMCGQPIGQAIYGVLFDLFAMHTWIVLIGAAVAALLISLYSKRIFSQLENSK